MKKNLPEGQGAPGVFGTHLFIFFELGNCVMDHERFFVHIQFKLCCLEDHALQLFWFDNLNGSYKNVASLSVPDLVILLILKHK